MKPSKYQYKLNYWCRG